MERKCFEKFGNQIVVHCAECSENNRFLSTLVLVLAITGVIALVQLLFTLLGVDGLWLLLGASLILI